uniref:Uncharacterized protein n=1 Tax=Plectus sambesii TaxID=2011161 RepID=A0A914VHN4_9BILA
MGLRPSRGKRKQRQAACGDAVASVSQGCRQYEDPRLHAGYLEQWCRPSPSPQLRRCKTRIIEREDSKRWKGVIFGHKFDSRSGFFPPSAVEIVDKPGKTSYNYKRESGLSIASGTVAGARAQSMMP